MQALVDSKLGLSLVSKILYCAWMVECQKFGQYIPTETPKKMNLAVNEAIVFGVYLQNPLTYKKYIYHFLHQFLKSFQLKWNDLSNWSTKSGDFAQYADFSIKSKPLKKIHHFENFKSLSSWNQCLKVIFTFY